jgi:hypothetical protein
MDRKFQNCLWIPLIILRKIRDLEHIELFKQEKTKKLPNLQIGLLKIQYPNFQLPHMEYEGSIGFVMSKMKKNYC